MEGLAQFYGGTVDGKSKPRGNMAPRKKCTKKKTAKSK